MHLHLLLLVLRYHHLQTGADLMWARSLFSLEDYFYRRADATFGALASFYNRRRRPSASKITSADAHSNDVPEIEVLLLEHIIRKGQSIISISVLGALKSSTDSLPTTMHDIRVMCNSKADVAMPSAKIKPVKSKITLFRSVPLSRVLECRAPQVYECVWYRAMFTVRRQLSYLRLSRVLTTAYCTVCTPSPRPVSAPRVHSRRITLLILITF
ncbi:hypothetical protein EVAR_94144_1 [Eumeta japonica]|uniref:Uncharacterized protein n=1 Tax=Eumeta variegata TaxID=151549 RepID=A0A4C1U850_EUMVA|nr:hypothetical protein EVAR_94144_1 [Eumeta japonica]